MPFPISPELLQQKGGFRKDPYMGYPKALAFFEHSPTFEGPDRAIELIDDVDGRVQCGRRHMGDFTQVYGDGQTKIMHICYRLPKIYG